MLDSRDALAAILAAMPQFPADRVPVVAAVGRILRQDVVAERDQPPFDRVTMDGIALRHASIERGLRHFGIRAAQHAGDAQLALDGDDGCIEVMTGSVLPAGSDCIVPIERIDVDDGVATVQTAATLTPGNFVHRQGSDYRKGDTLLQSGRRIDAFDIAVIASAGLMEVSVAAVPVIRVISTGNELVAAGQPIAAQQIRLSNGPALLAMLAEHDYRDAQHEHIVDDPRQLRTRLAAALNSADVLVLSGGVSMGKADFVPQILTELGVEPVFHKIAQRPGKPMWFGTGPSGQAVFALPGNPVSTLVCCRHYVLPALAVASGAMLRKTEHAVLDETQHFAADLTWFLPVRLRSGADGRLLATPAPTNTSGDFRALAGTDGYLELARDTGEFIAGSVQALHRWRPG